MKRTVRRNLGWVSMAASCVSLSAAFLSSSGGASFRLLLVPAVLAVLLAVAVRWGPVRHIAPAGGLTAAAMALGLWPTTADLPAVERIGASMFWTLPAVLAVLLGGYPRLMAHRRAVSVEQARRAQRLQLARDLHDFVAHDISGIVAQAQAARFVADSRPGAAGPALERIEAAGLAALTTMDRVVRMLHEPDGDPSEPMPALDDLPAVVERFRSAGPVDAVLTLAPAAATVPLRVGATAYRVVVEALTNVRRHAPTATRVEVSVTGDASGIEVRVHNDASRSPAPKWTRSQPGGCGLQALRDQVAAAGGTLTAGPAERGWEVAAVLPGGTR